MQNSITRALVRVIRRSGTAERSFGALQKCLAKGKTARSEAKNGTLAEAGR
jgi:hypothetical protein